MRYNVAEEEVGCCSCKCDPGRTEAMPFVGGPNRDKRGHHPRHCGRDIGIREIVMDWNASNLVHRIIQTVQSVDQVLPKYPLQAWSRRMAWDSRCVL